MNPFLIQLFHGSDVCSLDVEVEVDVDVEMNVQLLSHQQQQASCDFGCQNATDAAGV